MKSKEPLKKNRFQSISHTKNSFESKSHQRGHVAAGRVHPGHVDLQHDVLGDQLGNHHPAR